jgi:hypothetical protein
MKRNNFIILALLSIPAGNLFGMLGKFPLPKEFDLRNPKVNPFVGDLLQKEAQKEKVIEAIFEAAQKNTDNFIRTNTKELLIDINEEVDNNVKKELHINAEAFTKELNSILETKLEELTNKMYPSGILNFGRQRSINKYKAAFNENIKDYLKYLKQQNDLADAAAEEKRVAEEAKQRRVAEEVEKRRFADAAEKKRADEEAAQRRLRDADAAEHRRAAEEAEHRRAADAAEQRRAAEEAEKRKVADDAAEQKRIAEEKALLEAAAQEQARVEAARLQAEQRQSILLYRKRG